MVWRSSHPDSWGDQSCQHWYGGLGFCLNHHGNDPRCQWIPECAADSSGECDQVDPWGYDPYGNPLPPGGMGRSPVHPPHPVASRRPKEAVHKLSVAHLILEISVTCASTTLVKEPPQT